MQCPEVNDFPAPGSLFNVENFQGALQSNSSKVDDFHYNHLLTVIIPDSQKSVGNYFDSVLENEVFYKVNDLVLEDLADPSFISSFVRNGKLTLLSINTRIDCDNCIGVTPNGKLYLSINKETYQCLGLEGVTSHFTKTLGNKFFVCIDLADEKLLSNKKKLRRLKSRLKILKPFTVLLSWEPPKEDVCPSSIAKYFSEVGYNVKQCVPALHSHTANVRIPGIQFPAVDKLDVSTFVEWLGMVSLSCDLEQDEQQYLSSYFGPDTDCEDVKPVRCFRLRGFFTSTSIIQHIENIMSQFKDEPVNWIAVYVQGFSDSPVAWGNQEHHYFANGDNGYVLIFQKDRGIIYKHQCSRKMYK
ncbi:unnamed protein product [Phyllotreta striolata]|uniref:Uncharacterized protein n=1 Tax=Phyllotreta striolata TaxID=444603 RepID=A0A9N9TUW2_PHYSR|nr:unnamed protein product [Phyllotreta striolata]